MIIDVDTHWEAVSYRASDYPLAPWADHLPSGVDMLAFGVAGDLLRALPESERPTAHRLLPALVQKAETVGGPIVLHPLHESSASERVAWMDHVGIDHCLVNPGGYWQQVQFVPRADWPTRWDRCQHVLSTARRHRSTSPRGPRGSVGDPHQTIRQLEHAHAGGARASSSPPSTGSRKAVARRVIPTSIRCGMPAVRLGMLAAVIHVGNTESDFSGWADIRLARRSRHQEIGGLVRLANTQRTHTAQNLIAGMLYGGVFTRHPQLTVMLEEMRVDWVPPFFATLERQALPSPALGEWPYDLSGGDMLRRNVRSTPLPGFGDSDALDVLGGFARSARVVVGLSALRGQRRADRAVRRRPRRPRARVCGPGSWAATSSSASLGPVIHFRQLPA